MGIPILGKTFFLIEMGARELIQYKDDILPVQEFPLWR